ncbi:MAG: T9SS type A sorting domain-containing protein [Flavobacteriales bacterium]|nr:T9SS type A sorting domain-containing protein [Flavobacteriales bacterium]
MKKSILFIALIICFMFSHNIISAQSVTSYTFAQAAGSPTLLTATYTTHTSGTTDYGVYTAVPLGFTFEYNCTNYTTISISNDGFIVMGNALSNSYTPLSSGTSNNVISVCAADLEGVAAGSSLRSKMTGTSPNRVFTVEWKNYGEYWDGGDFTFQIKLYETTNVIEMYWVTNSALTSNSGFQVGLRGASNADFNNRTKANNANWIASTAGAANSDLMGCNTTASRNPSGIFTWTPPVGCAGAPTAGSAAASPSSITSCAALSTTLSVTGSSTGCGLTYQWQSAPAAGGPWTNISGATGITHVTSISANTYFRRVITCTASGSSANSASVLVTTTVSSPANDDPCNATLVTVNADLACGTVSAGTVSCAGNSGIAACAGSGADDDVWYKFVATSTVHNFDVLNVSGSVTDMVHEIFSGACGALSSVGCSDPNSSQFSGFTIGVTYYVRVYTYTSTGGQNTTFNLCIGTPPPPPSNDEPCGAIDLNVNIGSCAFQSADLGTTSTISTGMPAPGCSSLGPDVWFKVTVPAGGLIIDLSPNGGPTDFGMAWYTGPSCNNLTALVECDDDDSQNGAMPMICRTGASCTVPGDCAQNAKLATGTVVYVRVWEYGGGSFGPFDICAYEPAPAGAPSNCGSATTIASLPFTNSGQTTCCRVNSYTASQGCASAYQDGEDFLYAYTPAANQTIDITLTGTLSYTGIFVTDRCPSAGGVVCVGQATSSSGNPTLCGVNLVGGTTYYIMIDTDPSPTCTPFNINVTSSSSPSCGLNYTSSVIAYAPDLNAGTNIALPIDDRFSSSYVPFGFTFCFDGFGFSQGLVSSNGYLIFDPISCASNLPAANASPGAYSAYSISAAIPNTTNAPRNSIMFPWQDINPAIGGTIKYQTLGTAPNRRFVITFDQIPYYSCTTLKFTGQLKIFETTNTIEMHIAKKEICAGWNGGDGIMGLHNYNGTVAVTNAAYNYPTNYTLTNQAFRFTSNCGPACIILPVKLMSFSVNSDNSFNVLNWSTSTEVNNDYFSVEYSTDMVNFYELGKVDGAGNSNVVRSYQFVDNAIYDEVVYYRLKQVDFDGVYSFSDIVAVNRMEEGDVSIYPNPAKEALFLDINSKKEEQFTIRFVNVLGAVVQENIVVNKGTNTYQSKEFKQLQTGIYFVQLLNAKNETVKNLKIVKE